MEDPTAAAVDACQRGDDDLLEKALESRVDIHTADSDGCHLLHWAAINNHHTIVSRLLELGADPNVIGGILQSTPLHWSARVGSLSSSSLLVQGGALCNIRDAQGYTPLHLAVRGNHIALVAYLVFKFDDLKDFTDNSGMTAVMWAAFKCFQMFPIRLLIDQDSSLDVQEDLQGNTALHIAAQERNIAAVKELLRGDADASIQNKQHETALDLAENNRNQIIQKMLRKAMNQKTSKRCSLADDVRCTRRIHFSLPFLFFSTIAALFHTVNYGIAAALTIALAIASRVFLGDIDLNRSLLPVAVTISESAALSITWMFYIHNRFPWYVQISFPIAMSLLYAALIYMFKADPGVISPPKHPKEYFVELVESDQLEYFCYTCFVNRSRDSKHCSVCDRCVRHFDHHCPWLNQCVTKTNLKIFLLFVFSVLLTSVIFLSVSIVLLVEEIRKHNFGTVLDGYSWIFVAGSFAVVHIFLMGTLFTGQIVQISEHDTTNARIKRSRGGNTHRRGKLSCKEKIKNIIEFCRSSSSDASQQSLEEDVHEV